VFFPAILVAVCLGVGRSAYAQTVPSAYRDTIRFSAGGTASGYHLGYGDLKIGGASAFFDIDNLHHFGVEGEARWLRFHLSDDQRGPAADEHAATYLVGPRYYRYYGKFQPYAKVLVGLGQFNYPYNYAKENDLVVAPGGGFDYRLTRRIRFRAVDFEYQLWPQFNYGRMSSYGVSTGLRIKIF
jgi:hypothetical protein